MSWHDITEEEENQETQASCTQLSIIDGLLITANISEKEKVQIDNTKDSFSEEDAYVTMRYLKENQVCPIKSGSNYTQTDIAKILKSL